MRTIKIVIVATLLMCSFGTQAMTISATDSGWYDDSGRHLEYVDNYLAGLCSDCFGAVFNNFFVFDLSDIGPVGSAVLRIYGGDIVTDGTYTMFDVQTDIASLVAGGMGLVDTYSDLGSGTSFGSIDLLVSQTFTVIEITLNSAAIDSINANAGGLWALGGSYMSDEFHAFGITNNSPVRELVVHPVPVPGALVLFASGLLGMVLAKRGRHA